MESEKHKRGRDEIPAGSSPLLSRKEFLILEILIGSGRELYGLEMVEASGGALKKGSIYLTLHRMEEKGLVESVPELNPTPGAGLPRRLYQVTRLGERIYEAAKTARLILAWRPVSV